jgi:hypothetical protein
MDMLRICTDIGFCDLVPGRWHWLMPPVMLLLAIVLFGVPVARILRRSGRSGWWTIVAFVPLLNLIGLWVFAFSRWPKLERPLT